MLVGLPKHNDRIERLWLDVMRLVVRHFKSIFYSMEENYLLDPLIICTFMYCIWYFRLL